MILTLSLFDSSLKSEIPTIFLSLTSSAIFSTKLDLLRPYGISLIFITLLHFLFSSIFATHLTGIEPLPVE